MIEAGLCGGQQCAAQQCGRGLKAYGQRGGVSSRLDLTFTLTLTPWRGGAQAAPHVRNVGGWHVSKVAAQHGASVAGGCSGLQIAKFSTSAVLDMIPLLGISMLFLWLVRKGLSSAEV